MKTIISALSIIVIISFQPSYASALNKEEKEEFAKVACGPAWRTFLPDNEAFTAENIELAELQHYNPEDQCSQNIPEADFDNLYKAVKSAAVNSFKGSPSSFEVMVRFKLTTSQPSSVEMQVRDDIESDYKQLKSFKSALEKIDNIHSSSGIAYVVLHYKIKPASTTKQ
ncbi:hypothetical protein [Pseudomonas sp. 2FE]|uniref:hypothetical protein n=1 Tax=Pseudomonas sp. 2FE TaxID=2502190 RepID=UPI0010FA3BD1|nr:hypothetical protein [Pseudomonas sp. 2FE]